MHTRTAGRVAYLGWVAVVAVWATAAPAKALDRFPIVVPAGARAAFDSASFTQVREGGVHHAVDISVLRDGRGLEGPEVVAPIAGRVLREWAYGPRRLPGVTRDVPSERGGWYVWMRGVDGRFYYFAHLLRPSELSPGQEVRAGERIGFVGRSGNVQGRPHLHFAIRTARNVVDPYPELRAVAATAHEPASQIRRVLAPHPGPLPIRGEGDLSRIPQIATVIAAVMPSPNGNRR